MPIYQFQGKNKKSKASTIKSKQDHTGSLVEKILRRANEYDPKNDPAIREFKRKMRDIWRF